MNVRRQRYQAAEMVGVHVYIEKDNGSTYDRLDSELLAQIMVCKIVVVEQLLCYVTAKTFFKYACRSLLSLLHVNET